MPTNQLDRSTCTGENLASAIARAIASSPLQDTASIRQVRRSYSRQSRSCDAEDVYEAADRLIGRYGYRWVAYELIRYHPSAFAALDDRRVTSLSAGINSWDTVDAFARIISGPAWLRGMASDDLIESWASDEDAWMRRAALVSTVALNMRSQGGTGDVPRTFRICEMLVSDRDDAIVKGLSWALRELVVHDPDAVRDFIAQHNDVLAARIKREVGNKLQTGLKNPKRR